MQGSKKLAFLFLALAFASGLCGGYFLFGRGGKDNDSEYARRLATLEYINSELRAENQRATELNQSIARRLDRAKTILDELGSETSGAKDTIRRLELNLSILERAIQAIYQDH